MSQPTKAQDKYGDFRDLGVWNLYGNIRLDEIKVAIRDREILAFCDLTI